jgi:hypothetical protein
MSLPARACMQCLAPWTQDQRRLHQPHKVSERHCVKLMMLHPLTSPWKQWGKTCCAIFRAFTNHTNTNRQSRGGRRTERERARAREREKGTGGREREREDFIDNRDLRLSLTCLTAPTHKLAVFILGSPSLAQPVHNPSSRGRAHIWQRISSTFLAPSIQHRGGG